ncbi:hypothetical protein HYQ46_009269 [Verticillium longisporum]|nr:hypothetical protein HYQ46_009269 [Verticillium longisporum]
MLVDDLLLKLLKWDGRLGRQDIDVRVDFLSVEENPGQRRAQVEGSVVGVVGGQHERIGKCRGLEIGGQEGLIVDVRGIFLVL